MSHRVRTKTLIFARLFTACAAVLLLTATVMERNDVDGYQATHLFFMPRQTWEMDEGVGMLHDNAYYESMDGAALAIEESGSFTSETWQVFPGSAPSVLALDSYLITSSSDLSSASQQPALAKMRPILNLSGNTLPVEQTGTVYLWGISQFFILLLIVVKLITWLGDVPTPPPRRIAVV